jgi:hypothetical protein
MLCLMFESVRRGYLQHATGKPVTAEQLARMTGCSTDEVSRLLQELEDSGVFSRTEHGVIFNRRMVRDEHKRLLCSRAGKNGGGNPALTFKGVPKGGPKGHPKGGAKGTLVIEDEDGGRGGGEGVPGSSGGSSGSGHETGGGANGTPRRQTSQQVLVANFAAGWEHVYGKPFGRRVEAYFPIMADVVSECGGALDEAQDALRRFFKDRSKYLSDRAHPIELFRKNLRQYRATGPRRAAETPSSMTVKT